MWLHYVKMYSPSAGIRLDRVDSAIRVFLLFRRITLLHTLTHHIIQQQDAEASDHSAVTPPTASFSPYHTTSRRFTASKGHRAHDLHDRLRRHLRAVDQPQVARTMGEALFAPYG